MTLVFPTFALSPTFVHTPPTEPVAADAEGSAETRSAPARLAPSTALNARVETRNERVFLISISAFY